MGEVDLALIETMLDFFVDCFLASGQPPPGEPGQAERLLGRWDAYRENRTGRVPKSVDQPDPDAAPHRQQL